MWGFQLVFACVHDEAIRWTDGLRGFAVEVTGQSAALKGLDVKMARQTGTVRRVREEGKAPLSTIAYGGANFPTCNQ